MARLPESGSEALRRSLQSAPPEGKADLRRPKKPQPPLSLKSLSGAFIALAALLILAVALGGGGVRYGLANLVVQFGALALVAFYRDAFFSFWKNAPLTLKALVACSIALPLAHLVPLPESLWTALPGRSLAADARTAVGAMGSAPLSLDSARTLVALSGLIVPLAVLAVGWSIPREHLFLLGWVVVALGLVNLVLGIGQVLTSGATASFYPEMPMPGVLFGSFANRNSTGVFLVGALALAALLPAPRAHPLMTPARIAICVLLLIAIVLTRSRTALVLAVLPLLVAAVQFALAGRGTNADGAWGARKGLIAGGGAVLVVAVLAALLALAPGRLADTLDRFDTEGDPRSYIWDDAMYAGSRYWPVGAGMGSFDEVYQVDESLENMTKRRAGRAHNDYIEVAIEAGLPGLVMIAAWLLVWAWLTWRARSSPYRWVAWSGSLILLSVALQSVTDYPLRNQAMLAVASLALLLLARGSSSKGSQKIAKKGTSS